MAKSKSYGGIIFIIIVILAAAGGTGYYFFGRPEKQPEYSTVKVSKGNIVQSISATGALQTTSQVTISSQVSGNVVEIGADFNDKVKKNQMLLKIDPTTYEQRLKQADADLVAAKANTTKIREDTTRTKGLFDAKLVAKADYDAAIAQLAQSESTLVSREAAAENARTDLKRCTIYSPIDGVVLNRTTDVGGTVNVNQSAVALFTIINDLSKLQISADVSEADIGSVKEGQNVRFAVDAYLNQPFRGIVTQVRNFAKNSSGVVTFSVIIDVDNSDLRLKPGMTATANITIAERADVLMVTNNALRVRIPSELQAKMTKATAGPVAPASSAATAPVAPKEDPAAALAAMAQDPTAEGRRGNRGQGGAAGAGAGPGGRGQGGGGGRRNGGTGVTSGVGMNISNAPRTLYKLVTDAAGKTLPQPVMVRLGISDGSSTEIVDSLVDGDTLITYVAMPGAAAAISGPAAQTSNPFQQGGGQRGGGGGGGGGGYGGRGGF